MLNKDGEMGHPCLTHVLIFMGCVNVTSSFICTPMFSYTFIITVRNGLGIFLSCEILNSRVLLTSSKAFS